MSTTSREFAGKVAFVTGAASGIGRATALAFAEAGAHVALADRDADALQDTARCIAECGGQSLTLTCDVTDDTMVRDAVDETVRVHQRLDVAFNNAGIEQPVAPAADITAGEWDQVLGINLTGVFRCMKHQIPRMLEQGGGAIVNASSGAGVAGFPGQGAYAAAKHGVVGLTRSAALDYAADTIRINAICPGIVDTEMIRRFGEGRPGGREGLVADEPMGRLGSPDEIASAVLWLCSDAASFATGHALVVDGGQTL